MAKHHHDHGKSDSVPGKGAPVPKEHWERQYQPRPERDTNGIIGAQFDPMLAKRRTKTYVKVNEQDH